MHKRSWLIYMEIFLFFITLSSLFIYISGKINYYIYSSSENSISFIKNNYFLFKNSVYLDTNNKVKINCSVYPDGIFYVYLLKNSSEAYCVYGNFKKYYDISKNNLNPIFSYVYAGSKGQFYPFIVTVYQ